MLELGSQLTTQPFGNTSKKVKQKIILPPIQKKCRPLSTKFVLTLYKMSDIFYGSEGVKNNTNTCI